MCSQSLVLFVALLTATALSAPLVGPAQSQSCSIINNDGYLIRVTNNGSVKADGLESQTLFLLHFSGKTVQIESQSYPGSFLMLHSITANATNNSTAGSEVYEIVVSVPSPSTMITTIWTPSTIQGDFYSETLSLSQKTVNGDCYAEFDQDEARCADVPDDYAQISFLC